MRTPPTPPPPPRRKRALGPIVSNTVPRWQLEGLRDFLESVADTAKTGDVPPGMAPQGGGGVLSERWAREGGGTDCFFFRSD